MLTRKQKREMNREIVSLKRRDDGVFEWYEDNILSEEWQPKDYDEAWGMIIIKTLRHLKNILEKRMKDIGLRNKSKGGRL